MEIKITNLYQIEDGDLIVTGDTLEEAVKNYGLKMYEKGFRQPHVTFGGSINGGASGTM